MPGETNTSIRPGWFHHFAEDGHVKSLSKLMDTYYKSVGRNSTLLLNFPIAPDGLIPEEDAKRGAAFAKAVREAFKKDLARGAKATADNVRGNDSPSAAAKAVDYRRHGLPKGMPAGGHGGSHGYLTDDFIHEHGRPDVIITDPPRAGMHQDVIDTILRAKPKRMVYVSCNPATQARDLQLLDIDYKVVEVQPVDMFPHTPHVENVVLLDRKE